MPFRTADPVRGKYPVKMMPKQFPAGDLMARQVAEFPWETTPLGSLDTWPAALKIACGMMLNSHFPKAIAWGPELITIYNTAFAPILGKKENVLGRSFRDVWSEAWAEIGPIADKAMAGEATFIEDFPLVINRNGYDEQAYFTFCYSPIHDEDGNVAGFMDTVVETTAKMLQQKRTDFLNRELHHRIKNMLASVAALANQTLKGTISLEDARSALQARIGALAGAHTRILEGGESRADIDVIVRTSLAPHINPASSQLTLQGPSLVIDDRQSIALALAVNELATNSLKSGALSVPKGEVAIEWGFDADAEEARSFFFTWTEGDGPAVDRPGRKGFGSILLSQIAPVDFDGEASLDYPADGFRYRLVGNPNTLPPALKPVSA